MHLRKLTIAIALALGPSLWVVSPLGAAPDDKPAKGEDPAAMARRFFNAGQKAFAEGRFTEAAKAFEEAFRFKPHPAPLINAGDAWEKAGDRTGGAHLPACRYGGRREQDRADAVDRLAQPNPARHLG
jgi:hypothetical protein